MKPDDTTSMQEYAAIIVTFIAYANYANGQERKYTKDAANAKATTTTSFLYGIGWAAVTTWLFVNGQWVAWIGVLISTILLWVMYSNLVVGAEWVKAKNTWKETREDAEEKLFGYAISIVVPDNE